jgi:hypothetical protein
MSEVYHGTTGDECAQPRPPGDALPGGPPHDIDRSLREAEEHYVRRAMAVVIPARDGIASARFLTGKL